MAGNDAKYPREDFRPGCIFAIDRSLAGLPEQSNVPPALFRNPAGVEILRKLAAGLQVAGYKVSVPKPGVGCDAAMRVMFAGFRIIVIIHVDRDVAGLVSCELRTWYTTPIMSFARLLRHKPSQQGVVKWSELCAALDRELKSSLKATSIEWLTREQLHLRVA